ncbi:MAG: alkaline phosphatase PhoX [Actinomycetes bacterium]
MTDLDRRSFLRSSATVAAGGALLGGPFAGFAASGAAAATPTTTPLVDVPDLRDNVVRLALPAGFRYRSFHDTTTPVTLGDGTPLPGRHDGMAAFDGGRHRVTLVRNHEVNSFGAAFGASGPVYDENAPGGTTTIVTTHEGEVQDSFTSLSGTQMNCSGGPMPWGAWITCEETVNGPDVFDDFTRGTLPPDTYVQNAQLRKPHGFVFEVPAHGRASGLPIRHAGRFAHESVALDPEEGALYLTEDNFAFPSGFYRYVPPQHPRKVGRLLDGGRLFMLKVAGTDNADLSLGQPAHASYRVEWVEIEEPFYDGGVPGPGGLPTKTNDELLTFVSDQGLAQGAAKFSRLEGSIYDKGVVYFCSTQGGATPAGDPGPSAGGFGAGRGQIWAYDTRAQRLHLVYESPSREVLDFPDNVTVSDRGTLVVCEDNDQGNFLRGLSRNGRIGDLALNRMAGRENDEFAGSTFSPDGTTLFVNIQASRGLTFAIWGPWHKAGF